MEADPAGPPDQTSTSAARRRWRRHVAPALAALTALALVALLIYGVLARSPSTTIDDSLARDQPIAAPAFRLAVLRPGALGPRLERQVAPALADGWVSSEELRGTPFVLNIWASWCVPCRQEAPELMRAWRQARPRGVLFVGLDMQDTREDAINFMNRFGVDYLNIRDPSNETSRRYGATGIPETFFVTAQGKIVNHVIGVITPAQLRAGISAAMSGRPQAAREGGDQRPTR